MVASQPRKTHPPVTYSNRPSYSLATARVTSHLFGEVTEARGRSIVRRNAIPRSPGGWAAPDALEAPEPEVRVWPDHGRRAAPWPRSTSGEPSRHRKPLLLLDRGQSHRAGLQDHTTPTGQEAQTRTVSPRSTDNCVRPPPSSAGRHPWRTGADLPRDGVDHLAVIAPPAALLATAVRQQRLYLAHSASLNSTVGSTIQCATSAEDAQ